MLHRVLHGINAQDFRKRMKRHSVLSRKWTESVMGQALNAIAAWY